MGGERDEEGVLVLVLEGDFADEVGHGHFDVEFDEEG